MEDFWKRLHSALTLSRWPVLTAEQVRLQEQKRKLKRLYGKNHIY